MKHLAVFLRIFGYYIFYIALANVSIVAVFYLLSFFGIKDIPELTGEFFADLLIIPILILFFELYKKEHTAILFESSLQIKKVIKLISISVAARIVVVVVMAIIAGVLLVLFKEDLSGLIDQGVEFQWSGFDQSHGWETFFGFLSFSILGPFNEELLNRVVILGSLRKQYSETTSIVYSSIIFMLAHLHPGLYVSSFILGLLLAWIYVKWKNIWYAIILHILINLQPFILSYFIDKI